MSIIALCCFGERSSYILSKKIKELPGNEGLYIGELKQVLKQYDCISKQHSFMLAYGSISLFNSYDIRRYAMRDSISSIWLCPQANYRRDTILRAFLPYEVLLTTIDNTIFGLQDASMLWKQMMIKQLESEKEND